MSLTIIKKEVEVCKESLEVLEALAHIIAEIKAGKDALTIAGSSLPKVMMAVDGAQHIEEEVKAPQFAETAALGLAQIVKAVTAKKAEQFMWPSLLGILLEGLKAWNTERGRSLYNEAKSAKEEYDRQMDKKSKGGRYSQLALDRSLRELGNIADAYHEYLTTSKPR